MSTRPVSASIKPMFCCSLAIKISSHDCYDIPDIVIWMDIDRDWDSIHLLDVVPQT